jgi:hypothetical protein
VAADPAGAKSPRFCHEISPPRLQSAAIRQRNRRNFNAGAGDVRQLHRDRVSTADDRGKPCRRRAALPDRDAGEPPGPPCRRKSDSLGVRIEATYSVGEYDIVILSAQDSSGLLTWLNQNGYKVPRAAGAVVGSYLRQNLHFFLAKVNLERQSQMGFSFLRPIQVEYASPKFMLPIRLGTVNAEGPQDLIILGLSPRGRIETTNYRTVRLPSGGEVPLYVKASFGDFYRAMFDRQVAAEGGRAVFLEYAWDIGWCDPCAADPLSADD